MLRLKGTVIDTVDDVYDHDWYPWDVDKWIGWIKSDDKITLLQFLHQPALLQRYATADDIERALSELLNFGHDGLERLVSKKGQHGPRTEDPETDPDADSRILANGHICRFYPSRMFISANAYLARGPRGVQKDDKIVIFQGAKVPFVIRAVADAESCFTLVGECCKSRLCYAVFGSVDQSMQGQADHHVRTDMHHAMYGQAYDDSSSSLEKFALV